MCVRANQWMCVPVCVWKLGSEPTSLFFFFFLLLLLFHRWKDPPPSSFCWFVVGWRARQCRYIHSRNRSTTIVTLSLSYLSFSDFSTKKSPIRRLKSINQVLNAHSATIFHSCISSFCMDCRCVFDNKSVKPDSVAVTHHRIVRKCLSPVTTDSPSIRWVDLTRFLLFVLLAKKKNVTFLIQVIMMDGTSVSSKNGRWMKTVDMYSRWSFYGVKAALNGSSISELSVARLSLACTHSVSLAVRFLSQHLVAFLGCLSLTAVL